MTWSSQLYRQEGLAKGIDAALLERAVATVEGVIVPNPLLPAILTLNHLSVRADSDYDFLRSVIARATTPYRYFRIRKRSGGHRVISVPAPSLMNVQRWIAAYVLNPVPVHYSSFAFHPGASIYKCA